VQVRVKNGDFGVAMPGLARIQTRTDYLGDYQNVPIVVAGGGQAASFWTALSRRYRRT
jgi:hypothetical protein